MKKTIKVLKDKKGITLMTSLVVFCIVAILATALITTTSVATNMAYEKYDEEQAFLIAESVSAIVKQEVKDNGGKDGTDMYSVIQSAKLSSLPLTTTVTKIPGFENDNEVYATISFEFVTAKKMYITVTGVYHGCERSLMSEFDYDYEIEDGENPSPGDGDDEELTTHQIFQYALVGNNIKALVNGSNPILMRFKDPTDGDNLKYKVEVPEGETYAREQPEAWIRGKRNYIMAENNYIRIHQSAQIRTDGQYRAFEDINVLNGYTRQMPLWDYPFVNGLDPSVQSDLNQLMDPGNPKAMPACSTGYKESSDENYPTAYSCRYTDANNNGSRNEWFLPAVGNNNTYFVYIDYSKYKELKEQNIIYGNSHNIIFVLVSTGSSENAIFTFKEGLNLSNANDAGRAEGHTIYVVSNDAIQINIEPETAIDSFIYTPLATINVKNSNWRNAPRTDCNTREPLFNIQGGLMAETINFDFRENSTPDSIRLIYFRPKDVLPGKPQEPSTEPGEIPIRDNGYVAAG